MPINFSERDDLNRLVMETRVGVYVGVDPTAPSLHVGHLVPFMALYWMYSFGFPAFAVVGPLPPMQVLFALRNKARWGYCKNW